MSSEKPISVDPEVIPDPTHVEVLVWIGQYEHGGTGIFPVWNDDPNVNDPRRWAGGENTKAVLVKIRVPLSELRYLR